MTIWHPYLEGKNPAHHSVVGTVRVAHHVRSPQLGNKRDLLVYLPPSYAVGSRQYPVLYMHDGQNLFDNATSYVGEWQVDETMERLAHEGLEAIVVGIPNTGEHRIKEYSPFDNRWGEGLGDAYLTFITDTVKPMIDTTFRTLPARAHTGIIGSSMGGLISLYGYFRYPQTFGLCGAMSPAFWLAGNRLIEFLYQVPYMPGRVYMDIGQKEVSSRRKTAALGFTNTVQRVYDLLVERGYPPNDQVKYVEDPDGVHHESAWTRRMPDMLRFLLG